MRLATLVMAEITSSTLRALSATVSSVADNASPAASNDRMVAWICSRLPTPPLAESAASRATRLTCAMVRASSCTLA